MKKRKTKRLRTRKPGESKRVRRLQARIADYEKSLSTMSESQRAMCTRPGSLSK